MKVRIISKAPNGRYNCFVTDSMGITEFRQLTVSEIEELETKDFEIRLSPRGSGKKAYEKKLKELKEKKGKKGNVKS